MIPYKVKSVHQNVDEIPGFWQCQLLVFHEIPKHNTLLQNWDVHLFLACNIKQYLEKMELLVSQFGKKSKFFNVFVELGIPIHMWIS